MVISKNKTAVQKKTKKDIKLSTKTVNILIFITLAILFIARCASKTFGKDDANAGAMNNDLYYMIPTGKDILQNGIPKWNTFSYVKGQRIVVQQWAYCVLIYLFYSWFKDIGIFMFVILNSLLFVMSGAWYLKEKGIGWMTSFQISLLTVSLFLYLGTRPQSITMALLCTQCAATEKYINSKNKKWLFFIPLCTLLEMNLHGSMVLLHFAMILPFTQRKPKNTRFKKLYEEVIPWNDLWIPLALSVVSIYVNPYGAEGINYLSNSLDVLNKSGISYTISEMVPSLSGTTLMLVWLAVLIAAILEMVYASKLSIADLWICIGLLYLSMQPIRNIIFIYPVLFLLVSQLVNIPSLHDWISSIYNEGAAQIFQSKFGLATLAALSLLSMCSFSESVPAMFNQTITNPADAAVTPKKGLEYIEKNSESKDNVKIMTYMLSYPEFKGFKVLVDSRPEIYQKKLNHVDNIASDIATLMMPDTVYYDKDYGKYYKKIMNKYSPDYVIINKSFSPAVKEAIKQDQRYKKVIDGNGYSLYKFEGSINSEKCKNVD